MTRLLALVPLALLGACQRAQVVDACVEDPDLCAPCTADGQCVFLGNPCTDTVSCAEESAEIAVIAIGCSRAQERVWPPDEACTCQQGVCRSE